MFKPRGFYQELGDVEVLEHEGLLHMFYLSLPSHDLVGHAISKDGLSWNDVTPAIRTGCPGECDDDMIWTVSVTQSDDRFYMLYTACSKAEGGRVQRTGLAISNDLYSWEKFSNNPVAQAEPEHYEAQLGDKQHMVSWRDPKVYIEGGTFYCVVCGRNNVGPFLKRGSFALMTSKDMVNWELEAPLFISKQFYDMECPQLFKIGEYYYVMAGLMEDHTQRYWISKSLRGPYWTPGKQSLSPQGHYAGRVCRFNSEDVYCCWHYFNADGPDPWGLRSENAKYSRVVPSVLKVSQKSDGSLFLKPNSNWEKYIESKIGIENLHLSCLSANQYACYDAERHTLKSQSGQEIVASRDCFCNYRIVGTISVNASCCGIAFNLNEESMGYFVEFMPEISKVRILKHLPSNLADGSNWFKYEVVQEAYCDMNTKARDYIDFALLSVGGEIELCLNGEVVLSAFSTERTSGKIGFHVDSGEMEVKDVFVEKMRMPDNL